MSELNPKETAIFAMHMQGDIVGEGTAFGALFYPEVARGNIVENVNEALKTVRNAGGQVFAMRVAWAPDYSDMQADLPLLQMAAGAGALKEGSEGAALVAGIELGENDVIWTHKRTSPFTENDLLEQLRKRGIKNVVVCGVATNASVESAVRQAADNHFNTFVLSDCSSTTDENTHTVSLGSMGLFAQAITHAELAEKLS